MGTRKKEKWQTYNEQMRRNINVATHTYGTQYEVLTGTGVTPSFHLLKGLPTHRYGWTAFK